LIKKENSSGCVLNLPTEGHVVQGSPESSLHTLVKADQRDGCISVHVARTPSRNLIPWASRSVWHR